MASDNGTMENTEYRAMKAYGSPYEAAVVFRKGDRLQYERRESKWPGWIWCTTPAGEHAWVPEAWVAVEADACVMLRDYNAKELSVKPGDEVRATLQESGWVGATRSSGDTGWVPLDCLEKL